MHRRPPRAGPAALALLLLATAPATLAAQSDGAKRALAIEDYYRIRTIAAPRISPNGRWVLYTVTVRQEESNANTTETWLVPADASAPPRRIEHDGGIVASAAWSENRVRYRVRTERYLIDPERPAAAPVPDTPADSLGVTSPDGQLRALLVREAPRAAAATVASDFERRHEERFKGAQFDWLAYKRDGAPAPLRDPRDPVANPAAEIFLTSNGGASTRRLTRLGLQPSNLLWTRDSRALLFTADSAWRDELTYESTDLWLVTTSGTVRRLTHDGYVYTSPTLSPDRRRLAFVRGFGTDMIIRDKLDHGGPRDLYIAPTPDERTRTNELNAINLTANWDLDAGAPIWSADGRTIYFVAGIGGETHLFRVSATGGPVEQVTRGPRRIGSLTVDAATTRIAYTVGVHEQPGNLYSANIDGTSERRLTNEHTALLDDVALSRAEHVSFRSRDGTPIEGWLTLPFGYHSDGGPYPLIVSNHGGPHSADGYGFDFKHQIFAAHGYMVLEVNFRSSTGYGDAFKWGTWGAWGTKDGEDVMAGIDHVSSRFPVDRRRVGVTGHSYGGFMTNWLITQYPDRFAAAISGAGISNWISDYGLADIARTKETEFYGRPWEPRARDIMIRQSPLFYADRVRTPTLFVHGEVDYRVPFAEAEQFYFALKKNGVPAKIIMYEDQSHGIGGHWNNVHRIIHELRWWDQYLKAPLF